MAIILPVCIRISALQRLTCKELATLLTLWLRLKPQRLKSFNEVSFLVKSKIVISPKDIKGNIQFGENLQSLVDAKNIRHCKCQQASCNYQQGGVYNKYIAFN